MPTFVRNPERVPSHQWLGTKASYDEIAAFIAPDRPVWRARDGALLIPSLDGPQAARPLDWVIPVRPGAGFRPIRPFIFEAEFSPAEPQRGAP